MGPPTGQRYQPPTDEVPQFNSAAPAPEDRLQEEENEDETDSPYRPRRGVSVRRRTSEHYFRRNTSTTEEVMNEAHDYVLNYMEDMFHRDGVDVELPAEFQERRGNVNSETARCLRQIGDDLVGNSELNRLIDGVTLTKETAFETFANVAQQIFSDGVINWGRVVALLYFGYRLIVRVLFDGKLLMKIIKWILQFISERLVNWIVNEGGWAACKRYLGSTPAQMVGVFMAGCLLTALVFWMRSKK